jgi:hypothetical protein
MQGKARIAAELQRLSPRVARAGRKDVGRLEIRRIGDARELTLGSGGQACDDFPCLHRIRP